MNQLNQLIELTRSELKRDDRQRIMSLITVDAHARDIVLMLIRENVTDKVRCVVATKCIFSNFGCAFAPAVTPRGVLRSAMPTSMLYLIKLRASTRVTAYYARLTFNGLLSLNNV